MANPYWDKMTPAERSSEMKRRRAVTNGKKKLKKRQAASRTKHYKCKKCDERFNTKYLLANHVRYSHPKGAKHGSSEEDHSNHISYLFGKVETIIEHYADSAGVSRAALASGVGSLLQRKEVW